MNRIDRMGYTSPSNLRSSVNSAPPGVTLAASGPVQTLRFGSTTIWVEQGGQNRRFREFHKFGFRAFREEEGDLR
jgi:hypothetical protein